MGVLLKEIAVSEYPLLENFLYNAIFLAPGEEAPPREIIYEPEIFVYIDGFGNNTGDHGVAAEQVGKIIGMAWHGSSLPMDTSTDAGACHISFAGISRARYRNNVDEAPV